MSRKTRTSYLMRRAQLFVYANLSECLRKHKLTPMQYMLLSLSRRRGQMSSADLARRFMVTPQSVNELIATLQRKRLIARTRSSENRRVLRISVTPDGSRLLRTCDREVDAMEKGLFGCLKPPALKALRNALATLVAASENPLAVQNTPPDRRAPPALLAGRRDWMSVRTATRLRTSRRRQRKQRRD